MPLGLGASSGGILDLEDDLMSLNNNADIFGDDKKILLG